MLFRSDASDRGNLVGAGTQLDFTTHAIAPGALRRDVFYNIPGFQVSDLTASDRFPYLPDQSGLVPSFEAPSNVAETYGQRLSGWVTPPASGDYVFYIASDDQGQLFLSTDESPANKRLIAAAPTLFWVVQVARGILERREMSSVDMNMLDGILRHAEGLVDP